MKQPVTRFAQLLSGGLLGLAAPLFPAQAQTPAAPAPAPTLAWVRNAVASGLYTGTTYTAFQVRTDANGNVFETTKLRSGKYDEGYARTIKYSPDGQKLWQNTFSGGSSYFDATPVDTEVDAAGNFYITGYATYLTYYGSYNTDYVTVKYSPAGDQLWYLRYDSSHDGQWEGDAATALAVDAAGNAYVTGRSGSGSATVKYAPDGRQLWVSRFAGAATDVAVDAAGNVLVAGDRDADVAVVKYAPDGLQLWLATYDSPSHGTDAATRVAADAAGNVVVLASAAGDYATLQYSPTGQLRWVGRYDGPGHGPDTPLALALAGDGSVYVTGTSPGADGLAAYATLRYSAAGQLLWTQRYLGTASDLAVDASGNAYVTGTAQGFITTLKYDPAGQQQWVTRYADYNSTYQVYGPARGTAVAVDAQGNVLVTGNADFLFNSPNVATLKYVQPPTALPAAGCYPLLSEPRVRPTTLSTPAGQPLTFYANYLLNSATDPRGRTLQVAELSKPDSGTLTTNGDGTYTYTPAPGFQGPVKLTFRVQEAGPVLASPATGHYYEFVSAPGICWAEAKAAAAARTYQGMQGYLATITYQGEQEFLRGRQNGQYWLGASDAAVEGEWRWQTGPEAGTLIWKGLGAAGYGLAYTNWLPGQPDDYKNAYRPQGEDYGMLYGPSGLWNDLDACGTGSSLSGYVVEYGGLESCTPVLYTLSSLTITVGTPASALVAARTASPAASVVALPAAPTLEAYPNPSTGPVRVRAVSAQDGPAQLELFDLQGRRVRTVYEGNLVAGEVYEAEVGTAGLATGLYQLRLRSGAQVLNLRLSLGQ